MLCLDFLMEQFTNKMGSSSLCQHCSHTLRRRWIGRGSPYVTLPARSPNLTSPDVFLWGFVKDQVYRTPVRDCADLQEIFLLLSTMSYHRFRNTWVEVECRLDISHATNRSHVEVYGTYGKNKFPVFTLCSSWFRL